MPILTLETFPRHCSTQRATHFINVVTGDALYFRVGGKQDGKLWSADKFEIEEILKLMQNKDTKIINGAEEFFKYH